jgi:hypothetical protein
MQKVNSKFIFPVVAGLLSCNVSIADEVVYLKSSAPCQVNAYPAPEAQPLSEKLNCGEKVTVLERRGPIIRVRAGEDKVVWVIANDTTSDEPAEVEVRRLTEYQKKIEAELADLNNQVKRLSESSAKLINALMAAEAAKVNGMKNNSKDSQ